MTRTRRLCRTYSSHEYSPIDYAYVELTERLRGFLMSVLPRLHELKQVTEEHFLRVVFLDYTPTFIAGLPDEFDEFEDILNSGDMVHLPEVFVLPDLEAYTVGVEFSTIEIEDDGFRWVCRPKHAACECETLSFKYDDIGWAELGEASQQHQ